MLASKALSRKFEVLYLLDLMEDSLVHASNLAKKFMVLDAIKFVNKSWHLVKAETIQTFFAQCGFPIPTFQEQETTEILEQEQELALVAEKIGLDRSKLVVEEHLSECDAQVEANLIGQLVNKFIGTSSEDEMGKIASETANIEPQQPNVITFVQAKTMVSDLIAFTKANSFFSKEMDLLGLKAKIQSLYLSTLEQSSIEQYF